MQNHTIPPEGVLHDIAYRWSAGAYSQLYIDLCAIGEDIHMVAVTRYLEALAVNFAFRVDGRMFAPLEKRMMETVLPRYQ